MVLNRPATKFFTNNKLPAAPGPTPTPGEFFKPGESVKPAAIDPHQLPPAEVVPCCPLGLNLDMHVYLSTSPIGDVYSDLNAASIGEKEDLPHFVWNNITYGDYNEQRVVDFDIKFPQVRSRVFSSKNSRT